MCWWLYDDDGDDDQDGDQDDDRSRDDGDGDDDGGDDQDDDDYDSSKKVSITINIFKHYPYNKQFLLTHDYFCTQFSLEIFSIILAQIERRFSK